MRGGALLAIIPALFVLILHFHISFSLKWLHSTTGEFNVTPPVVYINWTDASGLGAYTANISINLTKDYGTSEVNISIANASLDAVLIPAWLNYPNYFVPNTTYCYFPFENLSQEGENTQASCVYLKVLPSNTSNFTYASLKNFTLTFNFTFLLNYPGRYKTFRNLMIFNSTNYTEHANISVYVDVPVNFTKLGKTARIGSYLVGSNLMNFSLKANNTGKRDAHFYYFNASEIANASAIFVNLSSSKLAMFLFDEFENFLAGSANTSSGKHELLYSPKELAKDRYFKLYIYGNDTCNIPYTAFISIFTIHALNASNFSQSFGHNKENPFTINLSAGENNFSSVFVLKNKGNYNYSDVTELKKTELIYEFTSQTGNNTHYFIVPNSAQDIRAELIFNDTNANYSLFLKDCNGNLLASAYYRKGYYEEIVNKSRVELSYASLSPGKYSIEVVNLSGNAEYNLTVYVNLSSSDFIKTNYSSYSSKDFREFENANNSKAVSFNFTLPLHAIPGTYKATLIYRESNGKGAGIEIPVFVKAVGAGFLVNGKLQNSLTLTATQNLERDAKFNLSFSLENFGDCNITNVSISFANLTKKSYYANITAIYINGKKYSQPFTIQNKTKANITIEILVNKTKASQEGIYQGYVLLNMSNSSCKVKPYDYLNVTIKLNMTKWLIVNSTTVSPSYINVTGKAENVTITFKVYYANSSSIINEITLHNITSIRLIHKNITSYYKDLTSTKNFKNSTPTIWYGDNNNPQYEFNITIPQNLPGGYYTLSFNFTPKDTAILQGKASKIIPIEGEAFYLSVQAAPQSSMQNGTQSWLNFTIWNYGLNSSTGEIKVYSTNSVISDFKDIEGACIRGIPHEGEYYDANFSLNAGDSCKIALKLTASSSAKEGYIKIDLLQGRWLSNNWNKSLRVTVPSSSSSQEEETTEETQQTAQQQEEEEEVWIRDFKIISYPSLISVAQGESKVVSVTVKNTGNFTLYNLTLNVEGVEGSWIEISSPVDLRSGNMHSFTVNFTVPKRANLGKREIVFNVSSKNLTKSVKATLEILPGEEYKTEVEQNLTMIKKLYKNISSLYGSYVREGVENATINSTLRSVESLISQAEALIKAGDYATAASIVNSASTLLQKARSQIRSLNEIAKRKKRENTLAVLGIIFLLFGGGLLVYMLLPPAHGYEPEKGYRYVPPQHRGKPKLKRVIEELKHKLAELRKKMKHGGGEA